MWQNSLEPSRRRTEGHISCLFLFRSSWGTRSQCHFLYSVLSLCFCIMFFSLYFLNRKRHFYSIKYVPVAMATMAPTSDIITQYLHKPARWRCGTAVAQQRRSPLAFEKVIWSTKLKINKNVIKISQVFFTQQFLELTWTALPLNFNSVLSERLVDADAGNVFQKDIIC